MLDGWPSAVADLQSLFEPDDGVAPIALLWGEGSTVVGANDAFLTMVGYTADELESGDIDWVELTPSEWRAFDEAAGTDIAQRGAAGPIRKEYRHRDGSRVPVVISGIRVTAEPFRWVSVVMDLRTPRVVADRLTDNEGLFRSVLDTMLDPVVLYRTVQDADGAVIDLVVYYRNQAAVDEDAPPAGTRLSQMPSRAMPDRLSTALLEAATTGEPHSGEYSSGVDAQRSGTAKIWRVSTAPFGSGLLSSWRDITSERQDEYLRFRTVADAMLHALVVFDAVRDADGELVDFRVAYANPAACKVTGIPRDRYEGASVRQLMPAHVDSGLFDAYRHVVDTGEPFSQEKLEYADATDGSTRIEGAFNIQAVKIGDACVIAFEDITERLRDLADLEAARSRFEHLATHDEVTGLANRELIRIQGERARAAARLSEQRFALFFLDLDSFKSVNDGLGHDVADEILREVGSRLVRVGRPIDSVASLGGDLFAMLCPELGTAVEAVKFAERIQSAFAAPFGTAPAETAVSASIGIVFDDHNSDVLDLLRQAETAMTKAKARGTGVELVDTTLQQQALHRFEMAATLRHALSHGGIHPVYQPIIELASDRIVGVEALARLRLPDGELISPDQFIWVAEDTGLITALGEQMLERACTDAGEWTQSDPAFTLAVNLSPKQLTGSDLAASVQRVVARAGFEPNRLLLEITESTRASSIAFQQAIRELSALGARIAIDDFGTGYSSLAQLLELPFDMLKLDTSFIAGIVDDARAQALVAAASDIAAEFELLVTAEGVETPEQLAALSRYGCHYGQGYLWSPPVEAHTISEMLNSAQAAS